MAGKKLYLLAALLFLTACSSDAPRIIQASSSLPDLQVTVGMATQIEMPDAAKVQSVTVGDPELLTAAQSGDVVSLVAKGVPGETNLIIRAREDGGSIQVYQYRVTIQGR